MKVIIGVFSMLISAIGISAQEPFIVRVISVTHVGVVTRVIAESSTVRYALECHADPSNEWEPARSCEAVEAGKQYEAYRLSPRLRDPTFNCFMFSQNGKYLVGQHYEVRSEKVRVP